VYSELIIRGILNKRHSLYGLTCSQAFHELLDRYVKMVLKQPEKFIVMRSIPLDVSFQVNLSPSFLVKIAVLKADLVVYARNLPILVILVYSVL